MATVGMFLYVDRPVRLSGSVTCSSTLNTSTSTFDNLVLRQGWNGVVVEATHVEAGSTVDSIQTYRNGTLPSTWSSIEEQAAPLSGPLGQILNVHSFDR